MDLAAYRYLHAPVDRVEAYRSLNLHHLRLSKPVIHLTSVSSLYNCNMMSVKSIWLLSLIAICTVATCTVATSNDLPLKLAVKIPLDSRSANVHLYRVSHSVHPFTVSYGGCHSLSSQHETHHIVSTVTDQDSDRLVWILPDDIPTDGCLSAWSAQHELVGRSEPLKVHKHSKAWMRKRHLHQGSRLNKRDSIPMTNASGIDAEGPWFDGVELLKNKEIGNASAKEAKAKSMPND